MTTEDILGGSIIAGLLGAALLVGWAGVGVFLAGVALLGFVAVVLRYLEGDT